VRPSISIPGLAAVPGGAGLAGPSQSIYLRPWVRDVVRSEQAGREAVMASPGSATLYGASRRSVRQSMADLGQSGLGLRPGPALGLRLDPALCQWRVESGQGRAGREARDLGLPTDMMSVRGWRQPQAG